MAFANAPPVHSHFTELSQFKSTPDLCRVSEEKISFVFLFNKCQGQRYSQTMKLPLFPVGASWPEVLPGAIGSANRHWARCQHQFNHKLQGKIRGGTRASCPWPTRTPCHQALRIMGSAEHLSSAMCHCTASFPC